MNPLDPFLQVASSLVSLTFFIHRMYLSLYIPIVFYVRFSNGLGEDHIADVYMNSRVILQCVWNLAGITDE